MGEILCALPFNGGAFGVVRCTIGLFPGYLVGFVETAYYITLGCFLAVSLSNFLSDVLSIDEKYAPLLWIAFYAISCAINIQHKSPYLFWRFINIMCTVCLCLVLMYFFGSLTILKPSLSRKNELIVARSFSAFQYLPQASWFFVGIESLPLACNTASLTRKTIAVGSVICVVALFLTNFAVLCVTFFIVENPAGLASQQFPLNEGYILVLGLTSPQASFLAFPSLLAGIVGLTFSHGKLICALAESRLLPQFFAKKTAANSPYTATLVGCLIGHCICWSLYFFPETMSSVLMQFVYLAAFMTYGLYSVGYIILKTRYLRSVTYTYRSPVGVFGAAYVILVFVLGIISLVFFQEHFPWGLVILVGLCLVASTYYFAAAKHKQIFSKQEQVGVSLASKPIAKLRLRIKGKITVIPTDQPERKSEVSEQESKYVVSISENSQNVHKSRAETSIFKLLMDKEEARDVRARAESSFCTESVDFCEQAIRYKQVAEQILAQGTLYENIGKIHSNFLRILHQFIIAGSPNEINISGQQRAEILKLQDFKVFSALHPLRMMALFDETTAEVDKMLRHNNIL